MGLRVLLIDDHTLFRVGLEGLLAHRNIEVIASIGDGHEGLKVAAELEPDIVLLDMRMPDIDGIGVLKRLREQLDPNFRAGKALLGIAAAPIQ